MRIRRQFMSIFHQQSVHFSSMKSRLDFNVGSELKKKSERNSTRIRRRSRVENRLIHEAFSIMKLRRFIVKISLGTCLLPIDEISTSFRHPFCIRKKFGLSLTRIQREFWVKNQGAVWWHAFKNEISTSISGWYETVISFVIPVVQFQPDVDAEFHETI